MAVKKMIAGKHPLTVRVTDDDYTVLRMAAAARNESVNEMMARVSVAEARRFLKRKSK